jgi:hypothetical protein
MQQTTAAEVRLDAGRAARFSASVRSTGGFDRLPRTRCAICRCSRRPKGRSWSRNDPESGECRFICRGDFAYSTSCGAPPKARNAFSRASIKVSTRSSVTNSTYEARLHPKVATKHRKPVAAAPNDRPVDLHLFARPGLETNNRGGRFLRLERGYQRLQHRVAAGITPLTQLPQQHACRDPLRCCRRQPFDA